MIIAMVVYKDPNGMSSREKYFWQSLIGIVAAIYLAFAGIGTIQCRSLDTVYRLGQIRFQYGPVAEGRLHHSFFQNDQLSAGCVGLYSVDLFRHRRDEQCRQSDRWPRRSDDYADYHGRYGTGCFRVPGPATRFIPNIFSSRTSRVQVSCWFSVARWPGRGWRFCGSTPIRRKCSWATSVHWHWAVHWERLP